MFFKITDFDGSAVKDADGIAGWMAELFTEDGLTPNLASFVGELHVRVAFPEAQYGRDTVTVTGITSTRMAEELTAGWGGSIAWLEGYDEEVFLTDEWVCVLPAALEGTESVTLTFNYVIPSDRMPPKTVSHTQSFSVAGYYTDPGNSRFYVPYPAMEWLYAQHPVFVADMLRLQSFYAVTAGLPIDDGGKILLPGVEVPEGGMTDPLRHGLAHRGRRGEIHIRHPHGNGVKAFLGASRRPAIPQAVHRQGVLPPSVYDGFKIVFHLYDHSFRSPPGRAHV